MAGLEFFSDVVATGAVLGVDWLCSPDEVAQVLGDDFAENRHPEVMWRDHGLVEFFWERASGGSWQGTHFSVQVHRLGGEKDPASSAITARYGPMPQRLRFEDLRSALEQAGWPLIPIRQADDDLRGFWQPDSTVLVLVVGDSPSPYSHVSTLDAGDVYRISAPHHSGRIAVADKEPTGRSGVDLVRHLVRLDEPGRRSWLARHPESAHNANWWLHQFLHIDVRIREQPQTRPAWVELRLWLLDEAGARGIFDCVDMAHRRAMLVGELFAQGIADGLTEVLPTADNLVQACLDAIPVTIHDIGQVTDWRLLDRPQMLALRRTKILISAAEYHLPRIADPGLVQRLSDWTATKPRLV